jgi:hypothetical protein
LVAPNEVIQTVALDKDGNAIGEKTFFNVPNHRFLSDWISRSRKNNVEMVPLINAITPISKILQVRNRHWSDGAIAHFFCNGNDFQNA